MFNSCYRIWHKQPPPHTIAQTSHQSHSGQVQTFASDRALNPLRLFYLFHRARVTSQHSNACLWEGCCKQWTAQVRESRDDTVYASSVCGSQSGRLLLGPARMCAEAAYISYHDQSPSIQLPHVHQSRNGSSFLGTSEESLSESG